MNDCPISVIGAVNLPMEIENVHCGLEVEVLSRMVINSLVLGFMQLH